MKTEPEPFHEVGDLLRSNKPALRPSPGLEARIIRCVAERQRPAHHRWWRWVLLPPSLAGVYLIFSMEQPTFAPRVRHETVKVETSPSSNMPFIDEMNPLRAEAEALHQDAEKAGKFLLECLPTIATTED